MIITDDQKDTKLDTLPRAGPSTASPPAFDDYSDNAPLLPAGGDASDHVQGLDVHGPPPDFSEYHPESFISNGNVISHDKHLNEDGEALYRFLISQTPQPPVYLLSLKGTHYETRTRLVSGRDNNGNLRTTTETYTETVVDFDFKIDVGRNVIPEVVHWSTPDSEPAYRGRSFKQVDLGLGRKKANRAEWKMNKAWKDESREKGYAPWIGSVDRHLNPAQMESIKPEASSKTLRQWADEYCASKEDLKEFTFRKVIYGWDIDALKSAARSTIHSTGYNGKIFVDFESSADSVIVRPDTPLARILSKDGWTKFFLCICLVYPIVLLYAWLVGGRWDVCGAAYALKKKAQNQAAVPAPGENKSSALVSATNIVGIREGEWLRAWEGTIKTCVNMGRKEAGWVLQEPIADATEWGLGNAAIYAPSGRGILPALQSSFMLDGYNP